jgi:hypothetical protein
MVASRRQADPAAMRRILVLLAFAAAACGPTGPRWVGDNIHVVDGYWVDTETPCLAGGAADCAVEVEAALRTLPPADRELVVGAALGGFPSGYVDGSGTTIPVRMGGGLSSQSIVLLDLADGRRLAITLVCDGPILTGEGKLVEEKTCGAHDLEYLRVDREPGFGS